MTALTVSVVTKKALKLLRYEPLRLLLERITGAPCFISILVMGICSSSMVKEWTEALAPYGLHDNSLSYNFMVASHGAVEALAEQWRIRNLACALQLRNQRTHQAARAGRLQGFCLIGFCSF